MLSFHLCRCQSTLALVQGTVHVHDRLSQPKQAEDGEARGYAFEKYYVGQAIEGRAGTDGNWFPVMVIGRTDRGLWNVHVSDDYPGYDMHDVPSEVLRRPLEPGQADFLVDNSQLKAVGTGLKYRHSKRVNDKSEEFAPWGTLVVGSNEGDGWVKTSMGYLPILFRGYRVLVRTERTEEAITPARMKSHVPAPAAAANASGPTEPPRPVANFTAGEKAEFRTKTGVWLPCHVLVAGRLPNTYTVIVNPTQHPAAVNDVPANLLRKVWQVAQNSTIPGHCGSGCMKLHVATKQGREFLVTVSKTNRLDMMMQMVCNRLKIDWDTCQAQQRFTHNGATLQPWTHLSLSGLHDDDRILMEEKPQLDDSDDQKLTEEPFSMADPKAGGDSKFAEDQFLMADPKAGGGGKFAEDPFLMADPKAGDVALDGEK